MYIGSACAGVFGETDRGAHPPAGNTCQCQPNFYLHEPPKTMHRRVFLDSGKRWAYHQGRPHSQTKTEVTRTPTISKSILYD